MTFGIQYGVVARRPEQGDHPTPGRGQAIAPTMDEPGKPIRSIVGAHPCGRPAAMDEPGKPLRSIVGAHPCGRPATVALPRSPYFLALIHDQCH